MKRIMCLVVLMASLSFADLIEIDLPVSENGWDHNNATFIGVNLKSYLPENQTIKSAALEFTGLQNLMEPETNDVLHINLLKSNYSGAEQLITETYVDSQAQSNFFKTNHSDFTWIDGVSDLGSYSDNNDKDASVFYQYKGNFWESSPEHASEKINGLKDGYHWRYVRYDEYRPYDEMWWLWNRDTRALWSRYSNWTTEDTTKVLDVNVINELMASSDGWIGFGLDADCHYIGNVKLVITTEVPEPGSLSLMFLGLTSLTGALLARRRKN